jgi:hypothetical protein
MIVHGRSNPCSLVGPVIGCRSRMGCRATDVAPHTNVHGTDFLNGMQTGNGQVIIVYTP